MSTHPNSIAAYIQGCEDGTFANMRSRIVLTLAQRGALSCQQLESMLTARQSTVSASVKWLKDAGVLEECGTTLTRAGRVAALLRIVPLNVWGRPLRDKQKRQRCMFNADECARVRAEHQRCRTQSQSRILRDF